ncbi:hypothetical protein OCK74_15120 [Chitinophagaceae bacterium LB-8]|uniref:Uncharacterized protein n=1 Tax=Paraflavisolibacter caeni TaxID=2982496 RepID=A0A9X2XWC7_9BACT|nr:hypothetical protein [Paraflavisolibacter caeni]MCU7550451.1 hypothetical protein [Paraflavisolibacter caeni]
MQHIMRVRAEESYRRDLIDVEVQMISKTSTAVRNHLESFKKKRKAKKWPGDKPFVQALRRRDYFNR